jgi:hypothetical protein
LQIRFAAAEVIPRALGIHDGAKIAYRLYILERPSLNAGRSTSFPIDWQQFEAVSAVYVSKAAVTRPAKPILAKGPN